MGTRHRILGIFLLVTLLATAARAGSVTITWDPNGEANLAGYLVAYGRTPGGTDATVNVGPVTVWTLTGATDGITYYFRVFAYDTSGLVSQASAEISTTVGEPSPTGLSTDRTRLTFSAIRSGSSVNVYTPSQTIVVTQNSPTPVNWSVSTSSSWLLVSPTTGTGTGTFTVQVAPASVPTTGTYDTSVTIGSGASSQEIPVRLRVYGAGTTTRAIGSFDTPVDGATNVVGAIPVTGWAIDDVQVTKVQIFRDPVGGEVGSIYVGDAGFVPGARPDIERDYSEWPQNYRAGWGFMLLTNMLADIQAGTAYGGNGTFRLHAYATDAEGNVTYLGSKTITANNRDTSQPFGTIDTPSQGGTVSGTAYANFGWALSKSSIPVDGSTMTVLIDGVAVGNPTYNNYRDDISGIFPGYANSNGAVGYYILDTTQFANGQHMISWVVTDSLGNTAGLGSRYFTVLNASSAVSSAVQSSALASTASASVSAAMVAELPIENATVEVARAAETDKRTELVVPEWTGEVRVRAKEAEPIELRLANEFTDSWGGTYEGYMIVGTEMRPLPLGSTLDAQHGTFTWQPGPGFVGTYQLVFLRTWPGGGMTKIPVRIRISPKFDRTHRTGGRSK